MPYPNTDYSNGYRGFSRNDPPSLEPLSPQDGVKRYLRRRRSEIADKTITEYERKLGHFIEWCNQRELENLNAIDGRSIDDFRIWRREESSDEVDALAPKTMSDDMYLFKSFLNYLESIEAIRPGLSEFVEIPTLEHGDGVRDIELPPERVQTILDHLKKFKYGHREHVVWLLHCQTGRRPGAIHSLDVDDLHTGTNGWYLEFQHRPDEGTSLKNKTKSEGEVPIPDFAGEVLEDYIESRRPDVKDQHGRKPLVASTYGRLSISVMRRYFYKWTRPCQISGDCPHNREIDECDAVNSIDKASHCPSAKPPYAARHGYITALRCSGTPPSVVSDRCDVSEEIIKKHYDERTPEDRRNLQREILAKINEESGNESGGYMES